MKRARLAAIAVALGGCSASASKLDPLLAATATPMAARAPGGPLSGPSTAPARDRVVDIGRARATCAVRASGVVDCWGRWGLGIAQHEPRRVPEIADAKSIDDEGDCILRASGRVACYEAPLAFADAGVADVVALGSGAGRCFVHRDGHASCTDLALPPASDAIAVTRSHELACIVRRSSEVACVHLGADAPARRWMPLDGVPRAKQLVLEDAASSVNGCAIFDDGRVRCFAVPLYDHGPLAALRAEFVTAPKQPPEPYEGERPTEPDAALLANATQIALGHPEHAPGWIELTALVGGSVVRWDGRKTQQLAAVANATQIAPGCALRASGPVACWGSNEGGALARASTIGRARVPPRRVTGIANASRIYAFPSGGKALAGTQVLDWGVDRQAPLPLPDAIDAAAVHQLIPTRAGICMRANDRVHCLRGTAWTTVHESKVRSIGADEQHLYALLEDGTLVATPPLSRPPPTPPPDLRTLISSRLDLCAIDGAGRFHCKDYDKWIEIPQLAGATTVSAPDLYGCAIRDAKPQCFWRNKVIPYEPRFAPALAGVFDIAVGRDRACAVHGAGTVTCWAEADRTNSARTVIPSGAIAVALGESLEYSSEVGPERGCAIMTDRSVTCWGHNLRGELDDGSIVRSDVPLEIPGTE